VWQQTISLNYFWVEGQSGGTGIVVGRAWVTLACHGQGAQEIFLK
jgi:hypothetical protein